MKITKLWKTLGLQSMRDKDCTEKHINETNLHIKRWKDFWKDRDGGKEALRVTSIKRMHLEIYRRYLVAQKYAVRTVNKHLATIRTALVISERHEIIDRRPRLEQLNETSGSKKLFIRNEQIDSLFGSSDDLDWPKTEISSGLWWMCSLILYRSYGFRTQELIAYEKIKRPITWSNVSFDRESPNPDSDSVNELGWLHYVPPKTAKKKSDPIYLPLTPFTHHALKIMERTKVDDKSPIFNSPRNPERFYGEWYRWQDLAGVSPKREGTKFTPYSLRKSCATYLNMHLPGLATAVCRWGESKEAKVASEHYVSDDLILFEVSKAPMPLSFTEFIKSNAEQPAAKEGRP